MTELETAQIGHNQPPDERQTLAYRPPDSQHILACPRVPVANVMHLLKHKMKWLEQFEQNQLLRSCCRHPENHDIEAWYSCETDRGKGVPDIYKFYCKTCEANGLPACHVKFCVGGNHPLARKFSKAERPDLYDSRPFWQRR
jgi:hypothetical protein